MQIAIDLHSHSGYAGGVGQIKLEDVSNTMKKKGIDIFGTGDCLLPQRVNELKSQLHERHSGLFSLENDSSLFLLQTEVILSVKLPEYKNKTIAHHLILFPNFEAINKMQLLMNKWNMKNTVGRPYIVCENQSQLEERLFEIQEIHPYLEIIPAHIMTPDGILGAKNNLRSIKEFYGEFINNIRIIETGLSADPPILEKIPDLQNLTFISNSDCHSAAYNRIGREFTVIESEYSYEEIISSMRKNHIVFTAEFNPAEGRYFYTGHRKDRPGHTQEIFFPDEIPKDLQCPICHKKMQMGVFQRSKQLSDEKIEPLKRNFVNLIPLIEVIAFAYHTKSITSKKILKIYDLIIDEFHSEINLWKTSESEIIKRLEFKLDKNVIQAILNIKSKRFSFSPPGFDGNYGNLIIG